MIHNFRSAVRQLYTAPAVSVVALASLAIGLGVNIVTFSMIRSIFLIPVPGSIDGGRGLKWISPFQSNASSFHVSWPEYLELRSRLTSFRDIACTRGLPLILTEPDGSAERIWSECVSANYFDVLGVRPALGRFFAPDATASPAKTPSEVIISYPVWRQRFAGAADVIGRRLQINNRTLTVVGVAPKGFQGSMTGIGLDYWVPGTLAGELFPTLRNEFSGRALRQLKLVSRLTPGVSAATAEAEAKKVYAEIAQRHPAEYSGVTLVLSPSWNSSSGGQGLMLPAIAVLQTMALAVLGLSCVNTVILLLARASSRQGEVAVRMALGATPGAIIRQFLTESVVLALAGVLGGWLVGWAGVRLQAAIPMPATYPFRTAADSPLADLVYGAAIAMGCGVVCGLLPAWRLTRSGWSAALQTASARAGKAGRWLRNLLIGALTAIALFILVQVGQFLKSYHNSVSLDPGFDSDRVLLAAVDMGSKVATKREAALFTRNLLARLNATPGVESAALSVEIPLNFAQHKPFSPIHVDGRTGPDASGYWFTVTPGFFRTLGIHFAAGRDFVGLAERSHGPEAVINEELARRLWPDSSPLGGHLLVGARKFEIVGVVRNYKYVNLNEPPAPAVYLSERDDFGSETGIRNSLFVKTQGAPLLLEPGIRRVIDQLSPGASLDEVRTLAQHVDTNLFMIRMPAYILGPIAPLALVMAGLGVFSVLSYSVAQRTREIGVRLAIGATPRRVLAMILRQGMQVVGVGVVIGLGLAFASSLALSPSLVRVPPGDLSIFLPVPALLLMAAAFACWLPGRRASRLNPVAALRIQ